MPGSHNAVRELEHFLAAYDEPVHALARHALAKMDATLPGAYRMVYENYNATVVAYSPDGKSRHALTSVATYPRWVNVFFLAGPSLPDPHHLLRGTGSTVRNVRLTTPDDFDSRVLDIVEAAVSAWEWPFDPDREMTTDVVSIASRLRPRRPSKPGK